MSEQNTSAMNFLELTVDVVAAFVGNNSVPAAELPNLIATVHGALLGLTNVAPVAVEEAAKPAVAIKKSVTPDYIVCLEDGLKFKSLKRHLRTKYSMTPEEYRAKWGLSNDYPMVAPSYAAARSNLAKKMGLGQQRKKPVVVAPPVKAKGRSKKVAA